MNEMVEKNQKLLLFALKTKKKQAAKTLVFTTEGGKSSIKIYVFHFQKLQQERKKGKQCDFFTVE
jgi:hypothetical protein